jgi:hypothetical protein
VEFVCLENLECRRAEEDTDAVGEGGEENGGSSEIGRIVIGEARSPATGLSARRIDESAIDFSRTLLNSDDEDAVVNICVEL